MQFPATSPCIQGCANPSLPTGAGSGFGQKGSTVAQVYERLREEGAIDNTVLRRIQRVLDLQTSEVEILGTSGGVDLQDEEE